MQTPSEAASLADKSASYGPLARTTHILRESITRQFIWLCRHDVLPNQTTSKKHITFHRNFQTETETGHGFDSLDRDVM